MASLLFRVVNPLVTHLLSSPWHRLLSGNTLLLAYQGRRSGRSFRTPVSYLQDTDHVHCFAAREHAWWRNLTDGREVSVILRGRHHRGTPRVTSLGADPVVLRRFLEAVPRDARPAGVRLDDLGRPVEDDVAAAANRLVHVIIGPLRPI